MSNLPTILSGFACFTTGQALIWFQLNSQFVWEFWEDKPLMATLLFGVPATLLFWFGNRFFHQVFEELWALRLIGFGSSYLIFPFLTWWIGGESMFTTKTMICVALSFAIIAVQLFWK
mgnify:CR=1 FL=1|tara:strand:+ start:1152 stop:1505 length:354 start_codon:yes stop_codon:yes gene_type:complete